MVFPFLDIEQYINIDHKMLMNLNCMKVMLFMFWKNVTTDGLLVHHKDLDVLELSQAIMLNVLKSIQSI